MFLKKGGGKKVSSGNGGKKAGTAAAASSLRKGAKPRGLNPFDVRSNAKTKYEVLGKRVKGQTRNVATARAQADAKRKKTLGAQYQKRNKANEFRDKRLGEQDPSMSLEDKMIARFQSERKRKLRNAQQFALHDSDDENDDGEELFLTHKGAKIDDYDRLNADFDQYDPDEDDHDRQMDKEIVETLHFGGGKDSSNATGEDGEQKKKTHKEIMQEVMLKSKMHKAERQKNKMAQDNETETLDKDFSDIRNLLEFRPTRANGKDVNENKGPMDEFDKLTREFAFEAKAKATERRMTPEEIATKERDRLAEQEKKRIARMNGEDDDDDDDDDGKKKKGKRGAKNGKKQPQMIIMPPTDDDLTDGYEIDGRFQGDNDSEEDEDEAEDEEEDEEEDDESDSEQDSSDDEATGDDVGADGEVDEQDEQNDEEEEDEDDAEIKAKKQRDAANELPFVFPCPESPEELAALFKEHAKQSATNRGLIIERILTYYSPRLSVENQAKMKSFFAILIRQFLKWGAHYAIHKEDLDNLSKHLFTLAQQMGDVAGVIVRELLINMYKRLHSSKETSKWPQLSELLLFRALIQIFPTTDLRHNVISPMETLLAESLMHGDCATPQEATRALFTCTLMLQIIKDKQRFAPEVLVCVKKLLRSFLSASEEGHWLHKDLMVWIANEDNNDASLPALALSSSSSVSAASVLHALLTLIDVASAQYAPLSSFDELFHPVYLLLHELTRMFFHGKSKDVNHVITLLHERFENCWKARHPLRLQSFAPALLPTFTPKFDENYTVRKDKTADKEKAQLKQLQRQVKRARKGAARELRRDAEFLAREKQEEENIRLEAKRAKQAEVWRWLEEQNATFNEQVKKGGNMLKGGGSGPAKKRRISKRQ